MARRKVDPATLQAAKAPPPASGLTKDVKSVERMSAALLQLATVIPSRTSLRQVLAFFLIAQKLARGEEVIMADLADMAGDDAVGTPIFGPSINRSYQILLAPTARDPDGLGWIDQHPDPADGRRKILRLTPEGEAVARKVIEALR